MGSLLAAISLSGCKGPIDEMRGLADELCACPDTACADAALKKYETLTAELGSFGGSDDEQRALADQVRRFTKCRLEKLPASGQALVEGATSEPKSAE